MSNKVTINAREFDVEELWSSIFGSSWEQWEWWNSYSFLDGGDWDKSCSVRIHWWNDPDDHSEGITSRLIDITDIVSALETLVTAGYTTVASGLEDFDFDASSGDCVIQQACFDEVIYG